MLASAHGYSFPSGHALSSAIFFSIILFLFKNKFKKENIFILINSLLILLIGFSRIYLNVHWTSDVLAGIALGIFIVTFLVLIYRATRGTLKKYNKTKKLKKDHFH